MQYGRAALLAGAAFGLAVPALAQTSQTAPLPSELAQPAPPTAQQMAQTADAGQQPATYESGIGDYFANWFVRSDAAKASQPHWMTPLVTVTPRLEQEVRYDQYWETRGNGSTLNIYDSGKGLELIPDETNEVLINPPAYQFKGNTAHPANGWLDDQFLVVKQRLLSANEQNGDYILTAFLGVTAPSGNATFTNNTWVVTPTIAGGMGWGDFDIQATLGVAIPTSSDGQSNLGTSVATNVAFQYHFMEYFWPEFEVNDTKWLNGVERGGKNQVFFTPGIIFGRFALTDRLRASVGAGYQFKVFTKYVDTSEQTPAYNHAWLISGRLAF